MRRLGQTARARTTLCALIDRVRARRLRWADLLRRLFAVDVLPCRDCGGGAGGSRRSAMDSSYAGSWTSSNCRVDLGADRSSQSASGRLDVNPEGAPSGRKRSGESVAGLGSLEECSHELRSAPRDGSHPLGTPILTRVLRGRVRVLRPGCPRAVAAGLSIVACVTGQQVGGIDLSHAEDAVRRARLWPRGARTRTGA